MQKHLFHHRRIEWISAAAISGWGATFLIPGSTMTLSAVYEPLLARFSETGWGLICLCLGLARIAALIVNGREPMGSPIVRLIAALAGMWVWGQFALAFGQSIFVLGAMSIGVPSTLVFLAIDVLAARQSAGDAALAWKRAHGDGKSPQHN